MKFVTIITQKIFLVHVVHHSVHHTMGDVTFTDCTVGGFAGPGANIGTASVINQPPSGSEGVFCYSSENLTLQVGDRNRIIINQ